MFQKYLHALLYLDWFLHQTLWVTCLPLNRDGISLKVKLKSSCLRGISLLWDSWCSSPPPGLLNNNSCSFNKCIVVSIIFLCCSFSVVQGSPSRGTFFTTPTNQGSASSHATVSCTASAWYAGGSWHMVTVLLHVLNRPCTAESVELAQSWYQIWEFGRSLSYCLPVIVSETTSLSYSGIDHGHFG